MAKTGNPGRRYDNPLGALSSSTYQISLYMISPTGYDAFTASGRRTINSLQAGGAVQGAGAAYLIAQSGGVRTEGENPEFRATGFTKDVYIDNLLIEHKVGAPATQTATGTYNVRFDITEPYSFSFTNNLRRASDAIIAAEPDRYSNPEGFNNGSRQFFILGIKFLGYDENGNIANGQEVFMDDGQPIDGAAQGNHLFETYYDIIITAIKFSIDGNATNYKIEAKSPAPTMQFGTKAGRLKGPYTVTGKNIKEMYDGEDGLFTQLNQFEITQAEEGPGQTQHYANKYVIEFIGDDADSLSQASMINDSNLDKSTWAASKLVSAESPSSGEDEASTPNDSKRKFEFEIDTAILSTFDTIIKVSSYMLNALTVLYKNSPTPDTTTGKIESTEGSSQQRIAWYRITPIISDVKWDGLKDDWSYTMTYRVETYQTPIVNVGNTNPGANYYGPHKRYDYWWTGQNKEILDYKQNLDFLFYNETIGNISGNGNNAMKGVNVGTILQSSAENKDGSVGESQSIQNAFITSLYSPDSYAQAKITILGDPDYLISDFRGGPEAPYDRFYGDDGFRINANGGTVFIEIDFKEAEDYITETGEPSGVMKINDSILFFKYPAWIAKEIKGVSYIVVDVKSKFVDGKFTQILDCVLNSFPENDPNKKVAASGASGAGFVGPIQEEDNGEGREPPYIPPPIIGVF
tara:strand:- start:172 stop:2244 length:2073 start_codon:yes stop_codon:yes gene_type:complete